MPTSLALTLRRALARGLMLAAPLLAAFPLAAQTVSSTPDDTVLKQVILFGRHGVRSAALPSSTLALFATRPYPDFGVPTGYLTPHGAQGEVLLGGYFRSYLTAERLLTGNDVEDAKFAYFRANSIQRSNISAASLATGLLPAATVPVYSYPLGQPDAVFDPLAAKLVTLDPVRAAKEVTGTYGSGAALSAAQSGEFSLIRSALFGYTFGTQPAPPTPSGLVDPTAIPIPLTVNTSSVVTANVINAGGLANTLYAADPFVMEYTGGLAMSDVAWGQLSLPQISQQTRIITQDFALELTTPYLNQLQSSNAASHILKTMQQAVHGFNIPGSFGTASTRLVVINSSDAYVVGLAALLHMHWLLPGYQADYCPPGGSLVFELRQSSSTRKYIVRIYYTAQTFDQLRNLTPLTLDQPPATQQLFLPGGKQSSASLDVDLRTFEGLLQEAIDNQYVQNPWTEVPPGPLTGVPLK